eukprot:532439_1
MSVSTSLGIIIITILWIYGFILLYSWYRFYKVRDNMLVIKRRGWLVIYGVPCVIVLFLIGAPLTDFLYWKWDTPPNINPTVALIGDIMNDLLHTPFRYFGAYIIALRYWLIYYDVQFSNSSSNLEWKQYITSSLQYLCEEKWWVDHRKDYGNETYLLPRVFFVTILLSIIQILFSFLYSPIGILFPIYGYVNLIIMLVPVIWIIYLMKKFPESNDTIYAYKECRLIAIYWIGGYVLYLCLVIIETMIGKTYLTDFMSQFIGNTTVFIISFLSTFWVLEQLQLWRLNDHVYNLETSVQESDKKLALRAILRDEKLLNSFMQHLIGEFSIECLLCVIEATQYKKHFMDVFNVELYDYHLPELPKDFLKSDIVYNDGNDNSSKLNCFLDKVHKLYVKYIKIGAEFEINIPYQVRQTITYMMNDKSWLDTNNEKENQKLLFEIFDNCIKEMYQLMNHSKQRFHHNSTSLQLTVSSVSK